MKYNYIIGINTKGSFKSNSELIYNFGSTKDISIKLERNKVFATMELSSKKSIGQFLSFDLKQFRDIFRKAYLMHVLFFGESLNVSEIYIKTWEDEYVFDSNNKGFPFMFSMITIPSNAKLNTYDWELVKSIVNKPKTKQDDDRRYAGLYAFLCSLGREYCIDKFTNLWTSMNAFYNRIEELFDEALFKDERFTDNENMKKISFKRKDEMGVDAMTSLFGHGGIVSALATEKSESKIIYFMSDYLKKWYEDGFDKMLHEIKNHNYEDERVRELKEYAGQMDRDEYSWLLFRFPYIVRCNFLHGNKVSPVISAYNDPEIIILEAVSYVISDFLNDNLIWLFTTEELSEKDYDVLLRFVTNYRNFKGSPHVEKRSTREQLQSLGY